MTSQEYITALRKEIADRIANGNLAGQYDINVQPNTFPKVSNLTAFNPSWQKLQLAKEQYDNEQNPTQWVEGNKQITPTKYISSLTSGDVANEWGGDLSPLSMQQYLQAKSNTPTGYMFDYMGRQLAPGTKLNVDGGSYVFQPSVDRIREIAAPGEGGVTIPLGEDVNDWVAVGKPGISIHQALKDSGVMPELEWGGTIGAGGWNAIKGITSVAGPGLAMLSPVASGALNAAQGAQNAYNASASGDTTGAVLAGVSSIAGAGGAAGTQSLANLGKSINDYYNSGNVAALGGAVGALSNLYSGYNQYQAGQPADTAGGGNMDELDYNALMNYQLQGPDEPNYEPTSYYDDLNAQFNTNDSGGGFGGWFDSLDWGKILPTVKGLGLTAYGQVNNASANSAAQQAAARAQQMQQSGADSALGLAREQFEYQKNLNQPFYNRGLQGFDQYASAITGTPMANGKTWSPTETPAYAWQQQQQDKNLGRTLRSLGRSNSTYGMNVRADANRNLAASEYDKQLNRLASLTDVARGEAASLGNASANYGNTAGNISLTSGENQANAALASGLMNINNANQNTRNLYSLADLGLKAWNTGG